MVQSFESGYSSTLSQKFSSTDTVMYVATPPTVTAGRIYLTDGSQKERVSYSGVVGSTLTGCVRGLSKTSDPATAGVGLNRLAGNPVVLVAMHDQLRDKNQATEALIYGKTYATTAARDAALGADGAAIYPYTSVYVTATGLHYNYNLSTALRESVDTGTATPNASTTVAGKVEEATTLEIKNRTATGATGAKLFVTPEMQSVMEFTAGEDLAAGKAVSFFYNGQVLKTQVGVVTTPAQIGSITGLDTSTTKRMFYVLSDNNGNQVYVYKKSADNKLYATGVIQGFGVGGPTTITIGTEKKLSDDVLEADDGFGCCILKYGGTIVVTYKLASDDKPYALAATYDGAMTFTAGTPTLIYNSVVTTTIYPLVSEFGSTEVFVGRQNNADKDAYNAMLTLSGTTISVTFAGGMGFGVTMNAGGFVLPRNSSYGSVCSMFFDDGTNIKQCTVNGGAVYSTATTITTGYIGGMDKAIALDAGRTVLFRTVGNILKGYVTNFGSIAAGAVPSYDSTSDFNVMLGNTGGIFDVCAKTETKPTTLSYACPQIYLLDHNSFYEGYNCNRIRKFEVVNQGLKLLDENIDVVNTPTQIGITAVSSTRSYIQMGHIDATKLMHSFYVNTEDDFIGIVKTTALSGATVNVITKGPATVSGVASFGQRYFCSGNGGVYASSATGKAIGTSIGTDTLLLK